MQRNSAVLNLRKYGFPALTARKQELLAQGVRVFDFSRGDPHEPTAPFISERLRQSIPAVSQYPSAKGLPELRRAVADYVLRRFGVALDAETQILQTNGSKEAIYNIPFVMIGADSNKKLLIAGEPGYPVPERSARLSHAEYFPIVLNDKNGYRLELESLSPDLLGRTAIVWLNYPHNPSGATIDLDYLKRQYAIARQYEILLCSDESYIDLYFNSPPPPSILQAAQDGVLAFQSCSKRSGMTGYRTGFVAGDRDILRSYLTIREFIGTETSVFTQHAAIAAWSDDQHAAERRAVFTAKRSLLATFFDQQDIPYFPGEGTIYLWVRCPEGVNDIEYADRLAAVGILVTPGSFFGDGGSGHVRVALVPTLEEIRAALDVWKKLT